MKIIHYNQVELQEWFDIEKPVNIIHHIKSLRKKYRLTP